MDRHNVNISLKANKVLNVILVALLLIVLRIWHLAAIQYDEKLEESRRPQRRVVIEPAKRATIRDRFNVPLAINKIQYNAAVLYSQLKQIPAASWERLPSGKKIKHSKRKEYISRLAELLGNELDLDPARLEDLIHAKASLYYNVPFVIKEDLTEKEYYRLKMLEKDWVGIQVQRIPKRHYPKGKLAGDIIGYMGAINKQEYEGILGEIRQLEEFLQLCETECTPEIPSGITSEAHARRRLKDLQEHAYTINDSVGKTGIEGRFEQDLRGYHGKKTFYSDAKGNFWRELPGSRDPLSGQRLLLTLSAELQEYAEMLLTQNEQIREGRASTLDATKQILFNLRQPWMKGGSILAMDPKTGEILAMASYPRFDPNDFVVSGNAEISRLKKGNITRWFEMEGYIGEIWDQKRPLEREFFNEEEGQYEEESKWLTLESYLELILPKNHPVTEALGKMGKIAAAIEIQKHVDTLLALSEQTNAYRLFNTLYREDGHIPHGGGPLKAIEEKLKPHAKQVAQIKRRLDRFMVGVPHSYDKVLLVDLCRLFVCESAFSPSLLEKVREQSLSAYHTASGAKMVIGEVVKQMSKELFRDHDFRIWRMENEKPFLKEKRAQEKLSKKQAKPYIDYLDAKETELFQLFWQQHSLDLLLAFLNGRGLPDTPALRPYLIHFQRWHRELASGAHPALYWRDAYIKLQKQIADFDPLTAQQYLATLRSFSELNRPLLGRYRNLRKEEQTQLEKHLAAAFYPTQGFGYGRSQTYRQAACQGSIFKLVTAYAALKERYQSLDEKNLSIKKLNPLEMIDHTHRQGKELYVGYAGDGKPIPRAYKGGRLPRSTHAIGRIDLIKALETSSNPYFSILAGDLLKSPEDLAKSARLFSYGSRTGIDLPAEIPGKVPEDLSTNRTGLYAMAIGQHSLVVTPLQTAVMLSSLANGGEILKPKIVNIAAGKRPQRKEDEDPLSEDLFPFQEDLTNVGINFPLFIPNQDGETENQVVTYPHIVHRQVFLPALIRNMLLEGMRRVVIRTQEESISSLSRLYRDHPEAISDYIDLREELIGKTSTAESAEHLDLDLQTGTNLYTHVWFGGIAFGKTGKFTFKDPDLVVVVYLRYGTYGKEAAPVAAQMVKKWREIKQKRG